jgi:hypothetical protein
MDKAILHAYWVEPDIASGLTAEERLNGPRCKSISKSLRNFWCSAIFRIGARAGNIKGKSKIPFLHCSNFYLISL